jgi:cyclopropane fatty-acyl-phospholipid synthase-like methyltransferase
VIDIGVSKTLSVVCEPRTALKALIDFGCGSGEFIQKIYKINSIKKIIGIELDSEQAISTKKRFSKINIEY